ncbi:TPM domain-containing protein [Pseudodesulfovibrio tunisiensis]|uniref:TPM domain-containing protein n=1 Tax=Pseudodesulfovibrio tunisiensis TaxID=463192 RepID=UPI001FB303A6|nr:TPM domain-containing protein [Pseudodesulfovibrio tunisiensis]
MKDLAQTFLTTEEQRRLVQCVQEVETRTAGEIVPVIAGNSYDYPRASALGALLMGTLCGVLGTLLFDHEDMWFFLGLFLGAYALSYYLLSLLPMLKRPLIARREMDEEVEEAAITTFFRHGLFRTRDETGILIYVSVFERKVWVLADRGINEKVDPAEWKEVADMVTRGIREDRPGEALCEAVARCGEIITEHFPVRPDDVDELPNLIVEGK